MADEELPPAVPATFSFGAASMATPPSPPQTFSFNLKPPEDDNATAITTTKDDESADGSSNEPLPKEVLRRVLGLRVLQDKRETLMKEYAKERSELEKKYRSLQRPMFEERKKIVTGEVEPELSPEDEATVLSSGADAEEVPKGIPDFWLSALGRNDAFEQYLEEQDIEALKSLVDVRCEDFEDLTGFKLEFEFSENSFFKNSVLTKTYHVPNLVDANGQPELEKIEGCTIDWIDPKNNLVTKEERKKQKSRRGKNAGQTRIVSKAVPQASFFNFFSSIKLPTDDDDDDDDEETEHDDLRDRIDNDVELAFALRQQIIPSALLWFTGEAADDDSDDDDDAGQDHNDDDDDDDDEDDDDDDDED